nr:MAG TPA: hypothetical protein [Caudoviricetes sp.]
MNIKRPFSWAPLIDNENSFKRPVRRVKNSHDRIIERIVRGGKITKFSA